jgi:hypothetical protein
MMHHFGPTATQPTLVCVVDLFLVAAQNLLLGLAQQCCCAVLVRRLMCMASLVCHWDIVQAILLLPRSVKAKVSSAFEIPLRAGVLFAQLLAWAHYVCARLQASSQAI